MKLFKSKEEKRLEHEKRIKYVEENWENMTDEERQHENFIWPAAFHMMVYEMKQQRIKNYLNYEPTRKD